MATPKKETNLVVSNYKCIQLVLASSDQSERRFYAKKPELCLWVKAARQLNAKINNVNILKGEIYKTKELVALINSGKNQNDVKFELINEIKITNHTFAKTTKSDGEIVQEHLRVNWLAIRDQFIKKNSASHLNLILHISLLFSNGGVVRYKDLYTLFPIQPARIRYETTKFRSFLASQANIKINHVGVGAYQAIVSN